MEAIELLRNYKTRVDKKLDTYFKKNSEKAKKINPLESEAIKYIKDFTLSGGKRLRPALMYYGFLGTGEKKSEAIIDASLSIELAHSFLLIHDDIIDRDAKRHGVPTLHERYKKFGNFFIKNKEDLLHFGNSMAMIAGDMAMFMSNEILFKSNFPSKNILLALCKLQEVVYQTIPGEMLDVVMEFKGKATENEILKMHESKTARYTFEGPLHLGCILAKGDHKELNKELDNLSNYALPLGKAFQIRDDILGVFGNERKLGKPVGSDIIEGKQTLLLIKALEKANKSQRKELKNAIGNKKITKKQIENFKMIIEETGSLEYSKNLSEKLVMESKEALKKACLKNDEAFVFLDGIADYIINRQQ